MSRPRNHVITVFITTNRFQPDEPQYANSAVVQLPQPANDTLTLVQAALRAVERLYRPGYQYKKAGVLLTELSPASVVQTDLFSDPAQQERWGALMRTVDRLNQRFGAGTVFCAAEGIEKDWQTRAMLRSPGYTTRWGELLVVVGAVVFWGGLGRTIQLLPLPRHGFRGTGGSPFRP